MKKTILFLAFLFSATYMFPQSEGEEATSTKQVSAKVDGMFQGIRLLNMPTPLQNGKKALGFRISHRLGFLSDGIKDLYGMDGPASVYLALDYGIMDNLMVGANRSSIDKLYSGYVKYTPLNQTVDNSMPISVAVFLRASVTTLTDPGIAANGYDRYDDFANRMSYVSQIIIARKFSNWLSVQIAPTYVHLNLVEQEGDANGIWAIATGASVKITKRFAIVGEYSYVLNEHVNPALKDVIFNSAGIGCEIGTGGHVFGMHLINSHGIVQSQSIAYTRGDWLKLNTRLGFNISRTWRF